MGNTKTTDESTRSPIDGTELVRLATGGANWKATLNAILTALLPGFFITFGREKLTADRTYFVRTDGSDSNTGLVDSAGGAKLTLQAAYDALTQTVDTGGFTVTIQVRSGTYSLGIEFATEWTGGGRLNITGDTGTPANVAITQTTAGNIFDITAPPPGRITISGFKLTTTTSATGLIAHQAAGSVFISDLELAGATASTFVGAIDVTAAGATLTINGPITISGNMPSWLEVNAPGAYVQAFTATITTANTPAWDWNGVACIFGAMDLASLSFAGTGATGPRYSAQLGGTIRTAGGGANFLPGNVAGSPVPTTLGADGAYYS